MRSKLCFGLSVVLLATLYFIGRPDIRTLSETERRLVVGGQLLPPRVGATSFPAQCEDDPGCVLPSHNYPCENVSTWRPDDCWFSYFESKNTTNHVCALRHVLLLDVGCRTSLSTHICVTEHECAYDDRELQCVGSSTKNRSSSDNCEEVF